MSVASVIDAQAFGLHYSVTVERGLRMCAGGHEILIASRHHNLIAVAIDCISGLLRLDLNGEPAQVVDHVWLLRLAARCCDVAAEMMERT